MRYITPYILDDLRSKMVFISGPRQVGKTTLAKGILSGHFPSGRYLDWDLDEDRQDILKKRWDKNDKLLIFDELHKFPKWKTWIKCERGHGEPRSAFLYPSHLCMKQWSLDTEGDGLYWDCSNIVLIP